MIQRIADYIIDVRSRSEAEKQRIVFLWTFVGIIIITLIWLVSFTLSVSNNNAEEARLREEAKILAAAKTEAALDKASTTDSQFKGVIPTAVDFVSNSVDNVVNGFWVIGNMIHK